jgi:hypothetical protein
MTGRRIVDPQVRYADEDQHRRAGRDVGDHGVALRRNATLSCNTTNAAIAAASDPADSLVPRSELPVSVPSSAATASANSASSTHGCALAWWSMAPSRPPSWLAALVMPSS